MKKKLVFCMLLLAFGAAVEMYDENRAGMDQSGADKDEGQQEVYDYQDLGPYRADIRSEAVQSILYQLFNLLQSRDDARLHKYYRPKFSTMENPLAVYGLVPYSELMDLRGAVAKRHAGNTYQKVKPETPQAAKEDVQIIRKGPFWVCYLKLCSYPDFF